MDNASWHKSQKVKDFCNENNITIFFIPPYSPEFNAIERVWSFLKSKVRQKYFLSANLFREYIYNLLDNINSLDSDLLSNLCCSLI